MYFLVTQLEMFQLSGSIEVTGCLLIFHFLRVATKVRDLNAKLPVRQRYISLYFLQRVAYFLISASFTPYIVILESQVLILKSNSKDIFSQHEILSKISCEFSRFPAGNTRRPAGKKTAWRSNRHLAKFSHSFSSAEPRQFSF